jgi:hypothetical protein
MRQIKDLVGKSGPSQALLWVNEWPRSETAWDKRENAMSRVRFQETAGGRERRGGAGTVILETGGLRLDARKDRLVVRGQKGNQGATPSEP